MLQIFNCPHCQGVFKAECDTANSQVECPHCLHAVDVGALPTNDHERNNSAQEAAEVNEQAQALESTQTVESPGTVDAATDSGAGPYEKPAMKVTEAEVTRSILPPGFNKTRKPDDEVEPSAVPEESVSSTEDGDEDLEPLLTVPSVVSPEVNAIPEDVDVEEPEPITEAVSEDNTSNESDYEDEDEDLVLPSLLENAATISSTDQVLGSLAESDSTRSMSAGIHVIETNEEEAALIERVIEDRRQFKRKKNVVMWFFGFVIIALTLLLLIK